MAAFQKLSSWFSRLKTWQKVLVIWLLLGVTIGPFISEPKTSNPVPPTPSQTGITQETIPVIQTGNTSTQAVKVTTPSQLTPAEIKKQEAETSKKLIEEYVKKNEFSLIADCKDAVKKQLKAPSTADFPSFDYDFWTVKDGIVIKSYVDAQNSFGAQLRNHFQCNFDFKDNKATLLQAILQ